LLSFAGLPLTAGFISKFLALTSFSKLNIPLLIVAVVMSAIALFFYAKIIYNMFFYKKSKNDVQVLDGGYITFVSIVVLALLVIVIGVFGASYLIAFINNLSYILV
jgi:NADH-quinone oxidoreductase subunit N